MVEAEVQPAATAGCTIGSLHGALVSKPGGPDTSANDFLSMLDKVKVPQVYQALQARWIWQDQLMWSRTQLLFAVQAAALASAATLSGTPAGWMILYLAGGLTIALYRLAKLDERNRDRTALLLNTLLLTNLPADTRIRAESMWRYLNSGGGIIRLVIGGFGVLDICLASYFLWEATRR